MIEKHDEKGRYTVVIEKGAPACTSASNVSAARGRGKTLILFSDDLDKALATFVLANGAAATGQKVTIFFTFWGLNVLKKVQKPSVQKDFFGKMFGMMLPSSSLKLKLSQMNMFGMGSRMMRFLMKRKGVDSLESLRSQALAQGVEFIACQMSMDMMGIQHEELLDEVTIGGVATYMERELIYIGGQDMETLCKIRDVYRAIAEFEVQFTQMYDLSLNEGMLLCTLLNTPKLTSSEIAEALGLSASNTSKVIRSVEGKKLITRLIGKEDKRQMRFSLTTEGKNRISDIKNATFELSGLLQQVVSLV